MRNARKRRNVYRLLLPTWIIPASVASSRWVEAMSSNQAFEEDVFVEEDLEEDEYLYQVAINFGDPNGSPGQKEKQLEYTDDTDEEDLAQSKKSKSRLPHNPNSGGFESRKDGNSPPPTSQPASSSPVQDTSTAVSAATEHEQFKHTEHNDHGDYPMTEEQQLNAIEPGSVLDFAKTISAIDWGSIVQLKSGTAGDTAEHDKFPFFAKTHKHWLHLLWDSDPHEWSLVLLNSKLEESEENLDELPPGRKIYIRDITEVYLELAPSTAFRVYLSADCETLAPGTPSHPIDRTTSEEDALEAGVSASVSTDTSQPTVLTAGSRYGTVPGNRPVVLKITPEPMVRWHAAMWVDALFAAMQLQIHETPDEVFDVRSRYYETVPAPLTTSDGAEGVELEDINLGSPRDDARGSEIDMLDIYDNKSTATSRNNAKSCCVVC